MVVELLEKIIGVVSVEPEKSEKDMLQGVDSIQAKIIDYELFLLPVEVVDAVPETLRILAQHDFDPGSEMLDLEGNILAENVIEQKLVEIQVIDEDFHLVCLAI